MIVIIFPDQDDDTPEGSPLAPETPLLEIPVAPVVAMVILVSVVFRHIVGFEEAAPAVLFAVTVMVPVALTFPQPPVNGMV